MPITQVSYPANPFIENMVVIEAALNVPRAPSQLELNAVFNRLLCNRAALFRDQTAHPSKTEAMKRRPKNGLLKPSLQQESASVRTFILFAVKNSSLLKWKGCSFSYRF